MKVICLGCGHKLDLGDSYDDYDGLVKCNICKTLLKVVSDNGKLKLTCIIDDFHDCG